jgi:hypothetical protein
VPNRKRLTNEGFLKRVREYLPMDAAVFTTDASGRAAADAWKEGLRDNRFHLFDAEAMLAASHAIEDLAHDEADGHLVRTFRDFRDFEPQRERYWNLAATIDSVRVVAGGRRPRPHGHLRFVQAGRTPLIRYWIVLYEGGHNQALLFCRQINQARVFEERQFHGFYSFNPHLIAQIRREIEAMLKGRQREFEEFARLERIDQAEKDMRAAFNREAEVLLQALRRLQISGDRYLSRHFTRDFDKALLRLGRWKEKVAQLLQPGRTPTRKK